MTRDEFLKTLDDLVELTPGTLKGPEKLEDLEGWTSMAMVLVIGVADENGIRLAPRQLGACEVVDDVVKLLQIES